MSTKPVAILDELQVESGQGMTKRVAYSDYSESDVPWIGMIPTSWELKRIKRVVKIVNEKEDASGSLLPYVGMEHVESKTGKLLPLGDESAADGLSNRFNSGDVLFGKLRPYLAKVALPDFDGLCSSELLVLTPTGICADFLHYYMLAPDFINVIDASTYGAKMPRASWDFIGSLQVACPSEPEQVAIASFLDEETSKIDRLVKKKERLIELLQEKRTALISHAVTKGLNPAAPLKESGVDWLGMIPEHWGIRKLKYLCTMKSGENITFQSIRDSDEYPVFGGNGLRGYTNRFTHDGNLILLGRQGAWCGNIHFGVGKFWASEHAVVVTPREKANVRWLGELLRAMNLRQYSQTAAQPGLSVEFVQNLAIPFPSHNEQSEIAKHIIDNEERLMALHAKVTLAIERLREYRTALISAAVTGKIDVRNHQKTKS